MYTVITIKMLASLSTVPQSCFLKKDLHNWRQFHNSVLEFCFLPSILKGLANISYVIKIENKTVTMDTASENNVGKFYALPHTPRSSVNCDTYHIFIASSTGVVTRTTLTKIANKSRYPHFPY